MSREINRLYEFDGFRLNPTERQLLRDGVPVPLTSKVFETLVVLVERSGHLVEKEELLNLVWAEAFVEEANLARCVHMLRKSLGERHKGRKYIETVPGRGYRFVADVRASTDAPDRTIKPEPEAPSPAKADEADFEVTREPELNLKDTSEGELSGGVVSKSLFRALGPKHLSRSVLVAGALLLVLSVAALYLWPARTKPTSISSIRTIAVLPFKPLVAGDRNEALELGMADSMITQLSNIREVVVRPIGSVRRYGGLEQDALVAGRELGVESVLDGTIQMSGGRIRVTARLVRVGDGSPLWTEKFDEEYTNIFAVQDSMSFRVVESLRLKLTGKELQLIRKRYTDDTKAYQLYLEGRYYWNKRTPQDLRKSTHYFEQAIALDPNYALAFTGLADAYALLANAGASPPHDMMPRAREAARKALSLDDDLAEAHTAMGQVVIYYDYDFAGAEREYQRAIELNPNYATAHQWYSELLTAQGRHEEALGEMRRALEIEPLSLILNRQYGASLLFSRQYDAAIEQMKKTVELDANFAVAHSTLSVAYRMKGRYAESVEELAKFQELIGGEKTAALMRESFTKGGWQEFLRAMTAEPRPANLTPYNVATFHAALGEKDKAFVELNKSYENREAILGLLKVDPRFDSLHNDPRFQDLARRFKFVP